VPEQGWPMMGGTWRRVFAERGLVDPLAGPWSGRVEIAAIDGLDRRRDLGRGAGLSGRAF